MEDAGDALAKVRGLVDPDNSDLDFRIQKIADAIDGNGPASSSDSK
jgi:hypothetical protein